VRSSLSVEQRACATPSLTPHGSPFSRQATALDYRSSTPDAALTWLGIHGHLGFDRADAAYFWRRLPYPDELLAADPPRLRDAKRLLAAGAVKLATGGSARVHSEGREYRTRISVGGFTCTCPWIAKPGISRGPCKHVLATAIFAATTPAQPETSPLTHPHA
jgi:hypothetical protein